MYNTRLNTSSMTLCSSSPFYGWWTFGSLLVWVVTFRATTNTLCVPDFWSVQASTLELLGWSGVVGLVLKSAFLWMIFPSVNQGLYYLCELEERYCFPQEKSTLSRFFLLTSCWPCLRPWKHCLPVLDVSCLTAGFSLRTPHPPSCALLVSSLLGYVCAVSLRPHSNHSLPWSLQAGGTQGSCAVICIHSVSPTWQ